MASCIANVTISGGTHLKARELPFTKNSSFGNPQRVSVQRKSNQMGKNRKFSVSAEYNNDSKSGGNDFAAGFFLGGALFGTLAYVFAPQIRRSLLNEDDHGFRKARRPIYYDEGLEKTRQTLNAKINQLNSAIDNVSSRLRGGGKDSPTVPVMNDPELEATL